jgi:hypothetical protein
MASLGQRIASLFRGGRKIEQSLTIRKVDNENYPDSNGWYIMNGNTTYAGPYSREKDAKGQLTRLRNGYTPAARRPTNG